MREEFGVRLAQTGHLFQGRYKAILIDKDNYLMQLVAYLHLNPVRANMVKSPVEYLWSSHRAYIGEELVPWLITEPVLTQLSPSVDRAQHLFAAYVDQQIGQGHRKDFHGRSSLDSRVCGEDTFIGQALRQADQEPVIRPDLKDVIAVTRKLFGVSDEGLCQSGQGLRISRIRSLLAWAVLEWSDATLSDLGRWLGRDVSSLSSSVQRLILKAEKTPGLLREMEQMKASLYKIETLKA